MDNEILETYVKLGETVVKGSWKKALDALFVTLRKEFVFDNLAVYIQDKPGGVPEAVYARAAGRGRSKEAEASWGEEIANQVLGTNKIVITKPRPRKSDDRIERPFLFGLPLNLPVSRGALVFVRFGGPEYRAEQLPLAALAASQAARIVERRSLEESLAQLDLARHRAQLQDDFIATISHELHTPLGFIKGYVTSLLRSDTIWEADTQREFLTIIDEESDHLLELIDRMLDSARLQSGNMQMDFQTMRLDSLLRDVAQRFQARFKDLQVSLALEPAPPIQADNIRLAQVFDNLFDNAMKYAPGSMITISLEVKENQQIITFSDNGSGIPSEHIPFLFERFYRVSSQSGKRGTGLGLFICKQIIQAHNGQISVRTMPGKGTAFRVELPVKQDKVD
jgi:signal transduction histidine kinase